MVPWLQDWNEKAYGPQLLSARATVSHGIVLEVPEGEMRTIAYLAELYIRSRLLGRQHSCGCFIGCLQPILRKWAASLLEPEQAAAVPFIIDIEVPCFTMEPTERRPFEMEMPTMRYTLFLELSLTGTGPCLTRARLFTSDDAVDALLDSVHNQLQDWDLRKLDARLQGFTRPVHIQYRMTQSWNDAAGHLEVQVPNLQCQLHLPA